VDKLHGYAGDKMALYKTTTILLVAMPLLLCTSCMPRELRSIDNAISEYNEKSAGIKLGDSKEKVLAILIPTQAGLSKQASKRPESFVTDNLLTEIFFFRSSRQADGLTTDDEFTPYVFKNGALVAIGWTSLGGPKSVAHPIPTNPNRPVHCFQNGANIDCH